MISSTISSSPAPVAQVPGRWCHQHVPPPPQAPPPAQSTPDTLLELGDDLVLSVGQFKGNTLVHIRQYWVDKNTNERRPGKRGITLRVSDVEKLEEFFDDIDMDIHRLSSEQGDFDKKFDFKLSQTRQVYVHMRQSVPYVRFEHEAMSGLKDVDLTAEQYEMLKTIYPNVKQAVAGIARTMDEKATIYEAKLSNWTAAKVINLGDKVFVDIRKTPNPEGGEAGGQGTRSGIAVRANEWEVLVGNLEPLYEAIRTGNLNYQLPLNESRKVSLNYYKETWYVVIREYFQPTGTTELRPGKKGINMRMDEWAVMAQEIPKLTEHLRAAVQAIPPQ